jgi:CheY-like chemotaxis protein
MRQRVLVVEDEVVLAVLVGPANTLDEAMRLARDGVFDLALLDVNLGPSGPSTPVARLLLDRGIPFAFLTGYGSHEMTGEFGHVTVLEKPFQLDALERTLERIGG